MLTWLSWRVRAGPSYLLSVNPVSSCGAGVWSFTLTVCKAHAASARAVAGCLAARGGCWCLELLVQAAKDLEVRWAPKFP